MTQQDPEESLTKEAEPEVAEVEDIEALKQALAEEKGRAETNLAGWQRAQADFINYKRRIEQEREEFIEQANARLVTRLLPVLDDFERAYTAIPPELAEASWLAGIRLIERKLWATLEAQGLSPIKTVGEPFDPKLHEAVMHGKGKEGMIIQEIQKGYKLHDRVIRPSRVIVGNDEDIKEKKEG